MSDTIPPFNVTPTEKIASAIDGWTINFPPGQVVGRPPSTDPSSAYQPPGSEAGTQPLEMTTGSGPDITLVHSERISAMQRLAKFFRVDVAEVPQIITDFCLLTTEREEVAWAPIAGHPPLEF